MYYENTSLLTLPKHLHKHRASALQASYEIMKCVSTKFITLIILIRVIQLTPEQRGLNSVGPLICGYFSIVNTTVLPGPWVAESTDTGEPQTMDTEARL